MEFINLIEIMNQTSIWIDKLSRLTSTRLRPVLIAQEPLGKAGRQLFRMAFDPPSSAKFLAERRKKILMRVHAHG
jgi:hypothetical protein